MTGGGGAAGVGSVGDLNISGSKGGIQAGTAINRCEPGRGAEGPFAGGVDQGIVGGGVAGATGQNYGGGGSGAANIQSAGGTQTGGPGADGVIIVDVYA